MIWCILCGVKNCGFFMLMMVFVFVIVIIKLVCWVKNVGNWIILIILVIGVVWCGLCMLVISGMLKVDLIFLKIFKFFFMFGLWYELIEEWLVLLKDVLNMYGMFSFDVIFM